MNRNHAQPKRNVHKSAQKLRHGTRESLAFRDVEVLMATMSSEQSSMLATILLLGLSVPAVGRLTFGAFAGSKKVV